MNSARDQDSHYRVHEFTIKLSTYKAPFSYTGNVAKCRNPIDREMLTNSRSYSTSTLNTRFARMVLLFVYLFVLFDVFAIIVAAASTPVIHTHTGPVQGELLSTVVKGTRYSAFKGIPYAKPPLGFLRFKPPVPIEPWIKILNATKEGNVCPQIDLLTKNFTGDENCLFINVFSPLTDLSRKLKKLKAVMVWIYGGSFKSGSSTTTLYGPDFLIENDVVFVSFNYRIGALGFLAMNHRNATGNAGLKDQNLALKWVRNNIAKFGGDPNKVTIFGQSAGGVSVDFHVLSDKSKGLFQRAISMSGSPLVPWGFQSTEDAENLAKKLGKIIDKYSNHKETLLRYLYTTSPYELVLAGEKMSTLVPAFRPTIEDKTIAGDDAFVTLCSVKKYSSGDFNKVPYITGFTAKESVTFAGSVKPLLEIIDLAISTLEAIGMRLPSSLMLTRKIISSATSVFNGISNFALQGVVDETTDILFKYGIDDKQKALISNSPEPVYYYQISFNPSISLHKKFYDVNLSGAAHGDDLAYIFYMPAADLPLDPSHPISLTRNRMTRMWTNFAKYGNPTPDGKKDAVLNVVWPNSGSSGTHLDIDEKLTIKNSRPTNANVKLMQFIGAPTAATRNSCPSIVGGLFQFLLK